MGVILWVIYIFHLESSYRFQAWSFFIKIAWGTLRNCKQRWRVWSTFLEWKRKHHLIDEIVDIALSETQIPLSIFTNLFHKRFQKHSMLESMLEILQQFYIQMETEPHDFFFSWRFFLIHLKVYEMSQACYCCWFNWRNSITCTHCNVISLEHNSIPQQAKSQRIDVDATTFHILWELFTIIKIFSSISLNWIEKFGCQKPTQYGQFMFYEAVKNYKGYG